MAEQQLTHIDETGDVRLVDVSQKADTERVRWLRVHCHAPRNA